MIIQLAERGLAPDALIRLGIRHLLKKRLRAEQVDNDQAVEARKLALMKICAQGPVAVEQHAANEQHYEVPAGFYQMVLGARLKYSSGYWG